MKIPVLQFHICEVPRNFFLSLLCFPYVASDHQVADFPFFLCVLILVTASPFLLPNQLCELAWEQVMYGVRCRTVALYMQKRSGRAVGNALKLLMFLLYLQKGPFYSLSTDLQLTGLNLNYLQLSFQSLEINILQISFIFRLNCFFLDTYLK